MPTTAENLAAGEHYVKMQGQEVFRRAVRAVVDSGMLTLERAGVASSDVAWFVPHQANVRIVDAAAQRLGIPRERTIVNLDRFGNTSAASIPLALAEAADDGRLADGDLVLLSGFGAGHGLGDRPRPLGSTVSARSAGTDVRVALVTGRVARHRPARRASRSPTPATRSRSATRATPRAQPRPPRRSRARRREGARGAGRRRRLRIGGRRVRRRRGHVRSGRRSW